MQNYKGELHIHSVLSPCASLDMGPKLIVQKAVEKGLDFIAITDHNSTKNLPAFDIVCSENNIKMIYGIEVETKEEVHILCYFDKLKEAEKFGDLVFSSLQPIYNDTKLFGYQVIVDHREEILGFEDRLLIQRSSMGLAIVVREAKKLNGICIPAHIDRGKNGLLKTLGFLPEDPEFPFLEVSKNCNTTVLKNKYGLRKNVIFKGCDAHNLEEIGSQPITFFIKEISLEELVLAFRGVNSRSWLQ